MDDAHPAAWRRLPGLPLFAGQPWRRAMAGRLEGAPVWLSAGAGPEVGLAGHVVSGPGGYVYGDAVALVADSTASPFAPAPVRAALAGEPVDQAALFPHLALTHPGYRTFPVGTARDDPGAVRDALAQVAAWAAGRGLGAVALPYTEAGCVLAIAQDAFLEVPSGGLHAHLAGLPRKRRENARRDRRALRERGLEGRLAEAVTGPLLDRAAGLRARQRAKYGLPASQESERRRLENVVAELGDLVDVFVVAEGSGDPVCFTLFVRDGDTWHALYTGSDYSDPRGRGAYFEATYYAPIVVAAGRGIRRISYGLGASRAKVLRGCGLVRVDCLLLGLTPAAEAAVAAIDAAWRTGT